MKSIFFQVLWLASCVNIYSQQTATVYGRIMNPTDKQVFLSRYSNFISYEEEIIDSAALNRKGFFRIQFPWDHAGNVTFHHGEEITEMYISPGDNIQLILDTEQFYESIRYEGKGALLNTYLAQKYLQAPSITQELYKMPASAFAHTMDSIRDLELAFCENYFSQAGSLTGPEQSFLAAERHNIRYDAANQKLSYPMLHGYLTGKRGSFQPDPGYYDFLNTIPLVAENAIGSFSYMEFLVAYVQLEYGKRLRQDTSMDRTVLRKNIIDEHWQGYLRDFLYANWVYETLTENKDMAVATALYATLQPSIKTPEFVGLLEAAFKERAKLAPGKPAPLFTVHDATGNVIELSRFRGKTVYLDIWATWCGPCIKEIPAMEKLIAEMAGEEIVFLSISVDTDEKAWRKMIVDKDMKGMHAISPGNFNSQIARAYQVDGIPHYVIIDKEGKIFNANAPRPGYAHAELKTCIAQ